MEKTSKSIELAETLLTLETGELAKQATSSILARLGDTMVLSTLVVGQVREDIDYFPLTVEYVERLYAGGRIKGSRWVKREGRPSDEAILTARLIDRSIRPLFPKDFKKEVQVVITVLSVDGENEPDILSIIATSAALSISSVPWNGPVSAVRMGYVLEKGNGNKEFIVNPGAAEVELSELDLIATQTKEKTVMIEGEGRQVPEDIVLEAIGKAHAENKKVIALIEDLVKKAGRKKEIVSPNVALSQLISKIQTEYKDEVSSLVQTRLGKESTGSETEDLVGKIFEQMKLEDPQNPLDKKLISQGIETVLFKIIREDILKKGKRPDGRKADDIREISSKVSVLPRTHGSAVFQRGETQVLTVVTLGSPKLEQLVESAEGEEVKTYMHHYSMPPYSVGETGRIGYPTRREIGHGALAERALLPVIPKQELFPYTIRVVSEVLSSNGSTSMASACGSTLALMDAGVPIVNSIAGIAMGLMSDDSKYVILTDILGLEDFSGDMDFKVAGSDVGITGIQLDVKIPGLTLNQIKEVFEKSKKARLFILEKMLSVMPKSRTEVSKYAPKIEMIYIPVEKIGELIGPGGKTIRNIIAQTGATVDVEDDGSVAVSGTSEEAVGKAVHWIEALTREVKAGEEFEGEVKRILPFGAFVEILPGKEGMVHVSQMAEGFVKNPADVVSIGQKVKVRVMEIDEQGRINLSMKFQEKGGRQPEDSTPPMTGAIPTQSGQIQRPARRMRGDFQRHDKDFPRREREEHPLSRQFKREREEKSGRRNFPPRRPRFRKDTY
ncbi:MAG: polyribonucleotide nucleotidyltransferase [Candidatus Levybacteria bacterium RIFCSPLOWO2_01_FULL_38_13]|nr:MAG: polyribonucleotide nucleotidyltransferase [Candidatus Levybacteria bacterium RIFCSPHIGHO2_01_FULL_41_15]OGH34818.1 MAG: polyribonucleotide nucleotidyltransferase [Candidatus Levybacteria bacterium RIFCSPLOWO2_01_FULL_38_13]